MGVLPHHFVLPTAIPILWASECARYIPLAAPLGPRGEAPQVPVADDSSSGRRLRFDTTRCYRAGYSPILCAVPPTSGVEKHSVYPATTLSYQTHLGRQQRLDTGHTSQDISPCKKALR